MSRPTDREATIQNTKCKDAITNRYVRWTEKRNMEEFLRLVALGRVDLQHYYSWFVLEDAPHAYQQ